MYCGCNEDILTIDVEEWFHILDIGDINSPDKWDKFDSRIEANCDRLLNLLEEFNTKATFFVLGWVAKRYPDLIKRIDALGHEIATHGYGHELIWKMSRESFKEDLKRAKEITEDIIGKQVRGYRAPGFSITRDTLWAFEVLIEMGFKYDSSIFPLPHGHFGINVELDQPFILFLPDGNYIHEIPISCAELLGRKIIVSGGGYFRITPLFLILGLINKNRERGRINVLYLHPRELDPDHPRLPMPTIRSFKSYVNLKSTEKKLRKVLDEGRFTSITDWLLRHEGDRFAYFF